MKGASSRQTGDQVVDTQLTPLMRVLGTRNLVELVAARPGELLLEIEGRGWVRQAAPEFSEAYWVRLAETLANWRGVRFDVDTMPMLSTKLPGGHRFEALLGRVVESRVSVAVRLYREVRRDLVADFKAAPALAEDIRAAFRDRLNVVVSGGTSAGKTSLLNACLESVPADERVLTVEDVRELVIPHIPNRVHFELDRRGQGAVSQGDILDHVVRARPDRVLAGEVSMRNAQAILLLLSTGHRGFAGTIHANSCVEVVQSAFHDRLSLGGMAVDRENLSNYLRRQLDLIVQVSRIGGGKRITEVWWPGREERPLEVGDLAHA